MIGFEPGFLTDWDKEEKKKRQRRLDKLLAIAVKELARLSSAMERMSYRSVDYSQMPRYEEIMRIGKKENEN